MERVLNLNVFHFAALRCFSMAQGKTVAKIGERAPDRFRMKSHNRSMVLPGSNNPGLRHYRGEGGGSLSCTQCPQLGKGQKACQSIWGL